MKLRKHKGYSFYDVIISLVILILASVYVTKIFVGAVEVNNKNTVLDACTFEAIETIENLKSLGSFSKYSSNELLQEFQRVQNEESRVYSRTFNIDDKEYKEVYSIELVEGYNIDKIKEVQVSKTKETSENDVVKETMANSLYKVTVEIYDEKENEVYNIETYFTESHKVMN